MPAEERDSFEVLLHYQAELRELVESLQAAATLVMLANTAAASPSPALKTRLLDALLTLPALEPEALVVTDATGHIEWFNPAFTAMCGYTLAELRGRKPGQVLQGPDTDAASVTRIRTALHNRQPCHEQLVNYHKDGSRYRADIRLAPILDDANEPLYFVARERKL